MITFTVACVVVDVLPSYTGKVKGPPLVMA